MLCRLTTAGTYEAKIRKVLFSLAGCRVFGSQDLAKGLQSTTEKVQAIVEAPQPANVTKLKSFLGAQLRIMENFYPICPHV